MSNLQHPLREMDFLKGEIMCVDKPLGWTSFDLVKRVRGALTRRLHVKKIKVGHAGTLDPLATGVVLIVTGKATSRIEELQSGVKEYIATLGIGATTPSFDLETPVDAVFPTAHITEEAVRRVLPRFLGRIEQVPPSFSAVKVDGKRAYDIARRGKDPELKPKILVIDDIELLGFKRLDGEMNSDGEVDEQAAETVQSRHIRRFGTSDSIGDSPLIEVKLRIVCSKGTYIRALARDIGRALDSGAHLTALRRTRVGDYTERHALNVDEAAAMIADCPIPEPEQSSSTRATAAKHTDKSQTSTNTTH